MSDRRRALIVSPTASHPRDYGNRNRVWQTTHFLEAHGYEIHFVLYPIEDDWRNDVPRSAAEMQAAWSSFTVIPPSIRLHAAAAGDYHAIDEWWDPQIGHYLEWLLARQSFTVMVVNYVFLSRAFEYAPGPVVKVLETHDIFSGRKEMLAELGVAPEFFYTLPDQEQIAFNRADIVIAIKDSEAKLIGQRTARDVVTLPFYTETDIPPNGAAMRPPAPDVLRVGFIGADNQVNIANTQRFLDTYERYERVYSPPMEIVIAGGVCRHLTPRGETVRLAGRVADIREFYDNIDVVVVPLSRSTGIKIKTGEALAQQVPIVATSNGFDGYPAVDEYHNLPSQPAVCEALVKLAFDRDRLHVLAERTRMAAKLAEHRAAGGYARLATAIKKKAARIALVTDQDITVHATMPGERLVQWFELCSHIAPTLLFIIGERPAEAEEKLRQLRASQVEFVPPSPDAVDEIERMLQASDNDLPIGELVLSLSGEFGSPLFDRLRPRFPAMTIDLWAGNVASALSLSPEQADEFDVWVLPPPHAPSEQPRGLIVKPLRYIPGPLFDWNRRSVGDEIVLMRCRPSEDDEMALEFLQRQAGGSRKVSVFDCDAAASEDNLFDHLLIADKPSRIVAVGSDRRQARLYREFARYAGIGFGRIACGELPYLYDLPGGQAQLCVSPGDAVACACPPGAVVAPPEIEDTPWERYWNMSVAKIRQ